MSFNRLADLNNAFMLDKDKDFFYENHYKYLGLKKRDIITTDGKVNKLLTDIKLFGKKVNNKNVIFRKVPILTPYDFMVNRNLSKLSENTENDLVVFEYPFVSFNAASVHCDAIYCVSDSGSGCDNDS